MAKRSVASGTISFGLVSIPVKFYLSADAKNVSFNLFTKAGNRVEQLLKDKVTGVEVSRNDCDKGYEYAKGQYVIFTPAEIKALDEGDSGAMEITEFVSADAIDLMQVEKTYYLDTGKGGDKAYRLLVAALNKQKKCAVAQWSNRGRQHLIVIATKGECLVAHQMFYADEVRSFELDAATYNPKDVELDMACKLIDMQTSDAFDANKYTNHYQERVLAAVEAKKAGGTVEASTEANTPDVSDLMEALKNSLNSRKK